MSTSLFFDLPSSTSFGEENGFVDDSSEVVDLLLESCESSVDEDELTVESGGVLGGAMSGGVELVGEVGCLSGLRLEELGEIGYFLLEMDEDGLGLLLLLRLLSELLNGVEGG